VAAVGIISTGITFAALQSPTATLSNNAINIGAADLRISTNGTTFAVPSTVGFTFDGVVPGGGEVPAAGDSFYLKNYGSAALNLKAAVSTTPSNLGNVNLAKTYFNFTRVDVPEPEVSIPLQTLISTNTSGGVSLGDALAAGATAQYSLRVSMDSDAYSGTGVGVVISGINLSFTGVGN
jgi:hypothetical protein